MVSSSFTGMVGSIGQIEIGDLRPEMLHSLSINQAFLLQPEEGGKQHQQNNSQYLEKIIDILQTSPVLAYRQVCVT